MFGQVFDLKGLRKLDAKQRITKLVEAIGGDTARIYRDYNGAYQYSDLCGELDIRITNSENSGCPWVDIYHFRVGPVALYRVEDDKIASDLIHRYKEIFNETPTTN